MIKQLGFLSKKADMSRDAFIKRYEEGHVPLIREVLGPCFAAYTRSYPIDAPFDAVTQVWYATQEDLARVSAILSDPESGALVAEDEEQFFDRSRLFFYAVDECVTDLQPRQSRGPKVICLIHKAHDVSRDHFIADMEDRIIPKMIASARGTISRCTRNYPIPDGTYRHELYDRHAMTPPDATLEIWFEEKATIDSWMSTNGHLGVVMAVEEYGVLPAKV